MFSFLVSFAVLLLSRAGARSAHGVGQACTYYGTVGTCIPMTSCSGAHGQSASGAVSGCEADPVTTFFFFLGEIFSLDPRSNSVGRSVLCSKVVFGTARHRHLQKDS